MCLILGKQRKTDQHHQLSGTVPHTSTNFSGVKAFPGVIKSLIGAFFITPVANSTQLRAGPGSRGLGFEDRKYG